MSMTKIWARKSIAALQADADQAGSSPAGMPVPLKRTLGATADRTVKSRAADTTT